MGAAQPQPTDHIGLLRIPGPSLSSLAIRFALLSNRDNFNPSAWPLHPLAKSVGFPGWWELDLDLLSLADGVYEYEFLVNGAMVLPDPYADTLTRFGGYRGLFTISGGKRELEAFDWTGESVAGTSLPQNNQIVIYERPIKWMASDPDEHANLVELGTFDAVIFGHLDDLRAMGINCIELLPIQDSPQTLNWRYGTRFFFAPDYNVGSAVDAKFFVKQCYARGIRVILDVVMDMYESECPLASLAPQWYNIASQPPRDGYGQELVLYDTPAYGSYYAAREFMCQMAEFWITHYHVDGYRIDDFAGIKNWEFVQEFHDRARAKSEALFPGKPFLVIAEDSNDEFVVTTASSTNPNGRQVVDAIWNFSYLQEIRRLVTGAITTTLGQPSRTVRVQHLISNQGVWNDYIQNFKPGYPDLASSVDYATSHDVANNGGEPRMMNVILGPMLQAAGLEYKGIQSVSEAVDGVDSASNTVLDVTVAAAFQRVFGVFAVLMTSVAIPMLLAGEEFGDVHDTDYLGVDPKQQDPVQWRRAQYKGNALLKSNVAKLIQLRTGYPALQRNEVEFFYFHPEFDATNGVEVFAYCRPGGQTIGSTGQVIVVANMEPQAFGNYNIPSWPWGGIALTETGYPSTPPTHDPASGSLTLSLIPFSVRVFTT